MASLWGGHDNGEHELTETLQRIKTQVRGRPPSPFLTSALRGTGYDQELVV